MRARTYLGDIETGVITSLANIRQRLGGDLEADLLTVETFAAVATRVMKKTNPSKIRDEARTVEISMRLSGKEQA